MWLVRAYTPVMRPRLLAVPHRPAWLALAAVTAFLLRPASYRLVLDQVDWRQYPFDRHGYGLMLDLAIQAVMAPVYVYALVRILWRCRPGTGILAGGATPTRTAASWLVLFMVGSPTLAQWDALRALPLGLSWPVLASALLWFTVTAVLRAAAVAPPRPIGTAGRRIAALLVAGAGLAIPCAGHAGVADFVRLCLADAADFSRLPGTLAAAGLAEIDPAEGPGGPAFARSLGRRRLWSAPRTGGALADAFTGYAAGNAGQRIEACWHVSRPGESAATALADLKRRFPPLGASIDAGTEFFYGRFERWRTRVDALEVIIGVAWPMRDRPGEGTAMLYVAKPLRDRAASRLGRHLSTHYGLLCRCNGDNSEAIY